MKKYILLLLLTATALGSCSDFLEPKSQTEYVPRNISSLNELLVGQAYIDPNVSSKYYFVYNDFFSDDLGCTTATVNHPENATEYAKYKPLFAWHPDMWKLANDLNNYHNVWEPTYERILGCNAVLDYIDEMDGAETEKAYVRGQALALRAFYYLHLVNLFGEPYYYNKEALGVPLKLNSDMDLEYPVRATVEEVYRQIVADLDNAEIDFLKLDKDKQFYRKGGRLALPMIQLVRARTALYMNDYPTAVAYAKKVINDWGLSLLDLNSITPTTAAPYYSFTTFDNPEAIWLFGSSMEISRMANVNLKFAPTGSVTRKMFNASAALLDSYDAADLRKDRYIVKQSASVVNYSAMAKIPIAVSSLNYVPVSTNFGRALRVSEAYLILAEASHLNGDDATAVSTLETLRAKRYTTGSGDTYKVPVASTSGEALFTFIKAERRREMCFEGLRWFDQRRWGMESFSREWKEEGVVENTFTMEKNDPAFTLPIPYDAIEKNTKLEQNKLSTPKY